MFEGGLLQSSFFFYKNLSERSCLSPDGSVATNVVGLGGGWSEEKTDPGVEWSPGNHNKMVPESC